MLTFYFFRVTSRVLTKTHNFDLPTTALLHMIVPHFRCHSFHLCRPYSAQNIYDCNVKIGALSRNGKVEIARQVFDKMPVKDVVTWNALITGYWQNGLVNESMRLFELMPERSVVSWNSMIAGCIENGMIDYGFDYFCKMPRRNVASWNVMVSGFVKYGLIDEAIRLFKEMPRRNVISYTAMIDGFLQKGMVMQARGLFDRIPLKNSVTWTVMISGYIENGMFAEAEDLFQKMPNKSIVANTAMISGYCKQGKMEDARSLFDKLEEKDHVAWNAMITGYSQNGSGEDALLLLLKMLKKGMQPDMTTLVPILTACSSLASIKVGRQAHSLVVKYGLGPYLTLGNALISMYSKCGDVSESEFAFNEIHNPDIVSWNTIIGAYAQHGLYEKACTLFHQMVSNGFAPDGITFLSLLSACGHAGKLNESMALFDSMVKDYKISPSSEHYACLVDILSRGGQLEKAYRIIQEMPFEGDYGVWGALLAACHVYVNAELGELAAKKILELDPQNAGAYVMLSNIYAAGGKWKEVTEIRSSMKENLVKKQSAYCWIELSDKVHIFVGGGVSHPEIDKICLELKQISLHMKTTKSEDVSNFVQELTCYG